MIKDSNILLSIINTKLRDNYDSLESLCDDLDYDINEVISILSKDGYYYDSSLNQFKAK
jgi:hypothetical protein